jgi:Fe-S-cluster-containing dehydrogenase component
MSDRALKSIIVDLDRCWGCRTCEVACSLEHGLPPNLSFIRVEEARSNSPIPGSPQGKSYVPVLCQHCDDPACVAACPSEALIKGADGIVYANPEACIGCGACEESCPYRALIVLPESGKPELCDLCATRQKSGRLPACVQHCPGRALSLKEPESAAIPVSGADSQRAPKTEWAVGRTVYKAR